MTWIWVGLGAMSVKATNLLHYHTSYIIQARQHFHLNAYAELYLAFDLINVWLYTYFSLFLFLSFFVFYTVKHYLWIFHQSCACTNLITPGQVVYVSFYVLKCARAHTILSDEGENLRSIEVRKFRIKFEYSIFIATAVNVVHSMYQ